jgi:hypothetical protein
MSEIYQEFIGDYVLCRSRNEGLNAGIVEAADETGVILAEARRLWFHRPLKEGSCWYEAVANSGLDPSSKISEAVAKKFICEDYSLTLCTAEAAASIKGFPAHEN